eukprot:1333052-Prymnesium_polylepis.2
MCVCPRGRVSSLSETHLERRNLADLRPRLRSPRAQVRSATSAPSALVHEVVSEYWVRSARLQGHHARAYLRRRLHGVPAAGRHAVAHPAVACRRGQVCGTPAEFSGVAHARRASGSLATHGATRRGDGLRCAATRDVSEGSGAPCVGKGATVHSVGSISCRCGPTLSPMVAPACVRSMNWRQTYNGKEPGAPLAGQGAVGSPVATASAPAGVKKQDFLEAEPYWDQSTVPVNTYKNKS